MLAGLLLYAGVFAAGGAAVDGGSESALQCFSLDPTEPFSRDSAPSHEPVLTGASPKPLASVCVTSLRVAFGVPADAASLSAGPRAAPRPIYLTTARLRL